MVISFRYVKEIGQKKLDRNFNFVRSLEENVDKTLERIKNNLEKELKIKSKKKNNKNVESTQEIEKNVEVSVKLLKASNEISNQSFTDLLKYFEEDESQFQLVLQDDIFQIKFNSPWISNLSLPTSILAGFYVYPAKLDLEFTDRHSSEFIWYRGKMPKSQKESDFEWQEIGRGFSIVTKTEDIGHHLKIVAIPKSKNGDKIGPQVEAISKNEVNAGPGVCPFETRHLFTEERLSGKSIRVVSYNMLADYYADSEDGRTKLFNYCPGYAIDIDYRKQLLIKEIVGYNADILCMQEVDYKVFDLDFIPFLAEQNMNGVHDKKGTTPEGLATFFRTDRFDLIENCALNIGETMKTHDACQELFQKLQYNEKLVARITDLSTTLQIVLLRSKEFPNKFILVANTHLYFHPDADHIRLLQIGFSMILVTDFIEKFKQKYTTDDISLLFCGDFNSVPECGIYKLMTEGHVSENFIDWKSKEEEAVVNVSISQPFKIKSACGTPKYTNFTIGFQDCLDYIFYQTDKFEVIKVVEMPSEEELRAHNAIPSVLFPSDHVAIVTELNFIT
ncbi:hypothetical protein PVAND_012535 [Polypedilum vanderplanki]|uniref:2',5'-phosphodiesterase 12 n=1 Tax=Polypedilum vanderplanki TaxID=319348 RepID=A0A9J6CLT8_POLVA|nr:hypothetical protein PVAND_012535 [Polypedilum vanderplanki]